MELVNSRERFFHRFCLGVIAVFAMVHFCNSSVMQPGGCYSSPIHF